MAETRPLALVLPAASFVELPGADALREAARADLHELLAMLELRVRDGAELHAALADVKAPLLLTFANVPAMPAAAVEGALEALSEFDVVLGPCADGGIYLLGLAVSLDEPEAKQLAELLASKQPLAGLATLLEQLELETAMLPPWFRLADKADVSFARSLAGLSLLSEGGEDEFLADRLRLWLEKNT